MSEKILVDKSTVNEAMFAILALQKAIGDDEFDYVYSALEKALTEAEA
jgi:hypothetical protein